MKKRLVFVLALCLMFSALAVSAYAAGPTITVSDGWGYAGDEDVTVYISLSDFPEVYGMSVNVEPASGITLVSATSGISGVDAEAESGFVMFYLSGTTPFDANASNICAMTFKIDDNATPGDYALNVTKDVVSAYGSMYTDPYTLVSGTIHVQGGAAPTADPNLTHHSYRRATCEESGNYEYWSDEAGNYYANASGSRPFSGNPIIPATGHDMEAIDGSPATCVDEGVIDYYVCSNEWTEDDDGHITDGLYKLENDEYVKIAEADLILPATGIHTFVEVPLKEATDTTRGTRAYYRCDVCGKLFTAKDAATEFNSSEIDAKLGFSAQYRVDQKEIKDGSAAALKTAAEAKGYTDGTVIYDVTPQASYDDGATWVTRASIPSAGISFTIPLPSGINTAKLSQYKFYVQHQGASIEEVTAFAASASGIAITAKEFSPFSVSWKAPAPDAPDDESPSASPAASPSASPDPSASPSASPAPGGRQNGGGPRTGDEANIALWITLLIAFAAGIAVLLVVRRKSNRG